MSDAKPMAGGPTSLHKGLKKTVDRAPNVGGEGSPKMPSASVNNEANRKSTAPTPPTLGPRKG